VDQDAPKRNAQFFGSPWPSRPSENSRMPANGTPAGWPGGPPIMATYFTILICLSCVALVAYLCKEYRNGE